MKKAIFFLITIIASIISLPVLYLFGILSWLLIYSFFTEGQTGESFLEVLHIFGVFFLSLIPLLSLIVYFFVRKNEPAADRYRLIVLIINTILILLSLFTLANNSIS